MAVKAAQAGLDYLPRSMIYNPLNAWGKQREVPKTPKQSFREWYLKNR
jgi:L-lactate dehydrogenase complex protein LldF